jgi:hypothetical protein
MTPSDRIFYAIQEAVWAGWSLERIKEEVIESYKDVLRDMVKDAEKARWS